MNKNKLARTVKLVVTIIVIAVVAIIISNSLRSSKTHLEMSDLKSNMLQIQAKCRVLNDKADMNNKVNEERRGRKLSEFKVAEENTEATEGENVEGSENKEVAEEKSEEIEKTVDEIIAEFKKLNIIPEEDYEKYYVLENSDLEALELSFKNEKDARYLINYETREVVITCGYQGQYLLSEMGLKD